MKNQQLHWDVLKRFENLTQMTVHIWHNRQCNVNDLLLFPLFLNTEKCRQKHQQEQPHNSRGKQSLGYGCEECA